MGQEEDGTLEYVRSLHKGDSIDYLIDSPQYISEAEARTLAMKPLLAENCDVVFLIDADEFYQYEDLIKIEKFVENNEFITWFKIPLKNFVGEGYLEEPFCPPRIFRTESNGFKLDKFYFDNEVVYLSDSEQRTHEQMSYKSIPKDLIWIDHFCWTNNEKSRGKIAYQEKHFSHGAGCSYKWDDGVKFNEEYYKKIGSNPPKIIK